MNQHHCVRSVEHFVNVYIYLHSNVHHMTMFES